MTHSLFLVILASLCTAGSLAGYVKYDSCGHPVVNLPVSVEIEGCDEYGCNSTAGSSRHVIVTFRLEHSVQKLTPLVLSKSAGETAEIKLPNTHQDLCRPLEGCPEKDTLVDLEFDLQKPDSKDLSARDVELTAVVDDEKDVEVLCAIFHTEFP